MLIRRRFFIALAALTLAGPAFAETSLPSPLSIGETWTLDSKVLGETRRINVYLPAGLPAGQPLPVMYMPDGGMQEDFLHVAGLLQVGASNGTTRPFLLVGIENTERRRDLTGPTDNAKDRAIAPRVGGSPAFRKFIRTELMPEVARRYRITAEKGIVGESLAGLFVVETLVLEPELFDTFIAIDPSIWWNDGRLAKLVSQSPPTIAGVKSLYIGTSSDARIAVNGADIGSGFRRVSGLRFIHDEWAAETHGTVYHPAALKALRTLLKPPSTP